MGLPKYAQGRPPLWAQKSGTNTAPTRSCGRLAGALRVIEYPQNGRDPCRLETCLRVRRCLFVCSLFPLLLPSPSALRHGAVALSRVLGSSSSCIADVGFDFFFFVIVSRFISLFQVDDSCLGYLESASCWWRSVPSSFWKPKEDMDWVDDLVLLPQFVMDEELLASFRESHAVCGTVSEESQYELVAPNSKERVCYYNLLHPEERHFIYMYECLFSKLGVRVPFTQFEQDILYECQVAPSQLHSNSWGFMKAFQTICWYLHLYLSLRGRRIFTLYEESFHNFKNYYFKLRAVEGVRPFYENERGEYQFRLYWYSGPESPKYDFDDLDETDQEIVTVLSQCCARAPFNTKILLTRSPSYIRTELEKMTNNLDAYKRMRARKKNQANRLAAATSGSKEPPKSIADPVNKVPPPGSENQPVTNRAEFKVPPTPANPSDSATDKSKSKKRKAYGHSYGSVYSSDFDVVGFTDKFIMENSRIAMDEAGLKSNLEFIMKAGIKAAGISRALQKKLADCPPTSRAEVDQLKEKLALLVKEKEEAEEELSRVKSELSKLKKSVKEADQLRKKAEAETAELKVKVGTLEANLAKHKEEYEELEDDSIKSNDNIVENLRLQDKVLVPTLKGPFFEDEAAVVGDAEKSGPQSGADDAEKTPPV
ncbi:hypothetical protein PIB30_014633 [Stylosanthes scabra]|uniref:Uncharacterized protein n=1 Tax=Stylosanthes scabra TaxID=79078 RepID=A0ABU6S683_9FABA|nr:hypothetical protein [Stylosanthes scabra]